MMFLLRKRYIYIYYLSFSYYRNNCIMFKVYIIDNYLYFKYYFLAFTMYTFTFYTTNVKYIYNHFLWRCKLW